MHGEHEVPTVGRPVRDFRPVPPAPVGTCEPQLREPMVIPQPGVYRCRFGAFVPGAGLKEVVMLAVVSADASGTSSAGSVRVLSRILRKHETVLVVDGVDTMARCLHLVQALRQALPRLRCVAVLADLPAGPDLGLVADLLESGAVPVLAVPDGAADAIAALVAERVRPDAILRLCAGADQGVTIRRWAR